MASDMEATVKQEVASRKKGLFSRMRIGKRNEAIDDKRDQTPSPQQGAISDVKRAPSDTLLEDKFKTLNMDEKINHQVKAVRFPEKDAMKNKLAVRTRKELQKPPSAREAAYGGPPRYDWIDIETAAAIKVQSIVRRNQTMDHLESQGITTVAIRNRSRKREARLGRRGLSGSADTPGLFACCGVGLAFGDATEENYLSSRQHEKDHYLELKKEREAKEESLRNNFKTLEAKKKVSRSTNVEEIIEVVDE